MKNKQSIEILFLMGCYGFEKVNVENDPYTQIQKHYDSTTLTAAYSERGNSYLLHVDNNSQPETLSELTLPQLLSLTEILDKR